VVPGLGDVEHGVSFGGLAGGDEEGGGAPFECGDAFFNNGLGGVLNACVDVAKLGEREQVACVVGVVEDVRGRFVNGRRPGIGGRIGCSAGVNLLGFELPVAHGRVSSTVGESGWMSARKEA
jgi:hypothetical protein